MDHILSQSIASPIINTELSVTPVSNPQADQRPTADTSALNRNTTPDIPFPLPASLAPAAHATQAKLDKHSDPNASDVDNVKEVKRLLKPFGITMLPYDEAIRQDRNSDDHTSEPSSQQEGDTSAP